MWSLPDFAKAPQLAGAEERAVVEAAQTGSEAAVEELFRRHWPHTHRAAYLIVRDAAAAEDIAQEAFLSALGALDRFDRRRPLAPWLHRIAVNRAIDHSRSRAQRLEQPSATDPPGAAASPEGLSSELMTALAGLAADHRAVIVLRHLLGYTPGEIARMLELPRGTVNSRLRRGLDALRSELARDT